MERTKGRYVYNHGTSYIEGKICVTWLEVITLEVVNAKETWHGLSFGETNRKNIILFISILFFFTNCLLSSKGQTLKVNL